MILSDSERKAIDALAYKYSINVAESENVYLAGMKAGIERAAQVLDAAITPTTNPLWESKMRALGVAAEAIRALID